MDFLEVSLQIAIPFLGHCWKMIWKKLGSRFCFSFVYHPQTNGYTKVVNRILDNLLRCLMGDKPKWGLDFLIIIQLMDIQGIHIFRLCMDITKGFNKLGNFPIKKSEECNCT